MLFSLSQSEWRINQTASWLFPYFISMFLAAAVAVCIRLLWQVLEEYAVFRILIENSYQLWLMTGTPHNIFGCMTFFPYDDRVKEQKYCHEIGRDGWWTINKLNYLINQATNILLPAIIIIIIINAFHRKKYLYRY